MYKIIFVFYLGLFSTLAFSLDNIWNSDVVVSFSTIRSDFELLLSDPDKPQTVNIEYAEGAVLHVSLDNQHSSRNRYGYPGKFVEIYGKVNFKFKNGTEEEKQETFFREGLFISTTKRGFERELPREEEKTTYIVLKKNSQVEQKKAQKTISYISTSQLTNGLILKRKNMKDNNKMKDTISLGSFSMPLTYDFENMFLHLDKPLKGISLSKNEIQPDIFVDVWYRSRNNQYGSSSRLFKGIDAVRVYDEWNRLEDDASSPETNLAEEGEEIRRENFEFDMKNAYGLLHVEQSRYTNAFLLYGSNIVLDVRAKEGGHKKYLEVIGTTMADDRGRGPANVHAYYDLNELKYTDQLKDNSQFTPSTSRQRPYYLMYTSTLKLKSHFISIWAVMQGRCDTNKEIYHFSIFYGESIKVKYYCDTNDIAMEDDQKFTIQSISASGKPILNECNTLRYTNYQRMDIQCTDDDATSIAIRQEPRQLWLNDGAQKMIKTELLIGEMKLMKDHLIKNGKSWTSKLTQGVSILDGGVLYKMQLPNGENGPTHVEVHAQFKVMRNSKESFSYDQLNFTGAEFTALKATDGILLNDMFTSPMYYSYDFPDSMDKYIIGSAYLTTKQLREILKVAFDLASIRCRARKSKSYLIKIVHLNHFGLDGFYECSAEVFLFKGNFRALTLSKSGHNDEISTERPITNFIYAARDNLFIPETESFDDVYAIRLPEMTVDLAKKREFGSPQNPKLPRHVLLMFKSEEP